MKSAIVCHGDCDGIISAFIYIKHYLMDWYPSRVDIVFTQPWRAHIDAAKPEYPLAELGVLDLALSREFIDFLVSVRDKVGKAVVIDHHISSRDFVEELRSHDSFKVIWAKAQSTPRLMKEALKPVMNPYEEFLVDVADICEGGRAVSEDAAAVADIIKLSIARDPGDAEFMRHMIDSMLRGVDLRKDNEVVSRAKIAKFLLNTLLRKMSDKAIDMYGVKIVALDLAESRIFAGLLGIASTEFAKASRSDVVLIRREEEKVVVTARSLSDRALRLVKSLAEVTSGRYGGHPEAASATLPDISLEDAVRIVVEVAKMVRAGDKRRRTG